MIEMSFNFNYLKLVLMKASDCPNANGMYEPQVPIQ